MKLTVLVLLGIVAFSLARPQKDGAVYSKEAIRQAQNTYLIPKDAEIQKVGRKYFFINFVN